MRFFRKRPGRPRRVGILAGSFNPPTIAHRELARSAAPHVDELLLVIPGALPHKEFFGATLEQRAAMLAAHSEPEYSIAASRGGLFIEIARESRETYGAGTRISFVCGADAAERILNWDYGEPGFAERMLQEFDLLVAPRGACYQEPARFGANVSALDLGAEFQSVSSTEVRDCILSGRPWEHLVPAEIAPSVREIYGCGGARGDGSGENTIWQGVTPRALQKSKYNAP